MDTVKCEQCGKQVQPTATGQCPCCSRPVRLPPGESAAADRNAPVSPAPVPGDPAPSSETGTGGPGQREAPPPADRGFPLPPITAPGALGLGVVCCVVSVLGLLVIVILQGAPGWATLALFLVLDWPVLLVNELTGKDMIPDNSFLLAFVSTACVWYALITFWWALLAGQKKLAAWVACLVVTSAALAVVWSDPASYRIKFCGRLMDQFGDPVLKATLKFDTASALGPQFKLPFGFGAGPFTVRTNRNGFFRVSAHARGLYFQGVQCRGYEKDLLGRQSERRPGVVYYYVRRYFPADIVCTGKGTPLHDDCKKGATDYTYCNEWKPYPWELMPPLVQKRGPDNHFFEVGKLQDGDLWLSPKLAPDSMHAVVRIAVPGGGVVLQSDPAIVIAPESGYQDVLEVPLSFRFRLNERSILDEPSVRFFARRERNGEFLYSLYELVGDRIPLPGAEIGFWPRVRQRTNPFGSRNLELSDENERFADAEWRAQNEIPKTYRSIKASQGMPAARRWIQQAEKDMKTRRVREHQERQARSPRILAEALELEKRRLEYAPIMNAVLAGQPHPPWPRAGITGGPNDVPPDYTLWLILLAGLGLAGVGVVLVVRSRRRKSPGEPAKPPERTLGE